MRSTTASVSPSGRVICRVIRIAEPMPMTSATSVVISCMDLAAAVSLSRCSTWLWMS